jgi:hypothetical protein
MQMNPQKLSLLAAVAVESSETTATVKRDERKRSKKTCF